MSQKKATFIPPQSNELLEKFVNCLMHKGKKSIARAVLKDCFEILKKDGAKKPEEVFEKAISNVAPQIEVRPRRVGGAVYQIPVEVKSHRQQTLAIRWILAASRARKGMPMAKRLALEFTDAAGEAGEAYKKRENVHKMAKANKAFAHFANF